MLTHWLRHYHRMGVRPSHTSVAIRLDPPSGAQDADLSATLRALQSAGVPRNNVELVQTPPSDSVKLSKMNAAMEALPNDSFFIYADVDEHFDYACNINPHNMAKYQCLQGTMFDQLPANGNISEARDSPALYEQFPLQCNVRTTMVPRMNPTKTILVTVGGRKFKKLRFRNTHATNASKCVINGAVRHYSMTGQQLASNTIRRNIQPQRDVNYANATCGNTDPKTGACKDYDLMLQFMLKQVSRAAEEGSAPTNLCKRNLTHELWETPSFEERVAEMTASWHKAHDRKRKQSPNA
jgi:hypothetical protein